MPIKGDITSSSFAPQIRLFDNASGSSKLKGAISEFIRAQYNVRLYWYAEPSSFSIFDGGGQITRLDGKSFADDGFQIDENISVEYGFDGVTSVAENAPGTITAISEDGFTLFTTINSLTNGNYDSTFECLIVGTSILDQCIYRFGLIENEESFNTFSKLTGEDQKYYIQNINNGVFEFGQISGNIKGWADENEAVAILRTANTDIPINRAPNFGGAGGTPVTGTVLNYTIQHTFPILPYYTVGQLQNIQDLIAPPFLQGNNSLKHVFEATFKQNISDEENNKQVRFQSLDGSVGFYNENFNGFEEKYSVTSVAYEEESTGNNADAIIVDTPTKVSITLNSVDGTFTGSTTVVANHSYLPQDDAEYIGSQNFANQNFASQSTISGGGGSIITSVIATFINANELQVELVIDTSSALPTLTSESFYLLSLIVEDESLSQNDSNRVALLVDVNNYDQNPDIPDLLFVESEKNFSWIDDTAGSGFDDFKGWIEDSILSKFEFKLDRATKGAILNTFSYKLVAWKTADDTFFELQDIPFNITNQIIDSVTGDQIINISASRGLSVGNNIFNTLELNTVDDRTGDFRHYTGQVATKIDWQEWLSLPDADTIFRNPNEPNDGLNRNASNYSLKEGYELRGLLFFEVSQEDNAAITEYIHTNLIVANNYEEAAGEVWTCQGFETRKASDGTDLNGNIIDSETIIIKAVFEPSGFVPDVNEYVGMIRIEPQLSQGINQIYQIGSNRPVDAGYPLIPLDGETFASLTWDGTFLNVECQTNNNFFDISSILPCKLSSRLWKTTEPVTIFELIFRTDIDNTTVINGEVSTGSNSGWIYKGVTIVAGDIISQAIATADGTDQDLIYFADDATGIDTVVADGNEYIDTVDLSELTELETVSLKNNRMTSVTLPQNNAVIMTALNLQGSQFAALDMTDVNFGGFLTIGTLGTGDATLPLASLILPSNNNNVWTGFRMYRTSLVNLDLSEQNGLGGVMLMQANTLLTNINFGTSNETFTQFTIAFHGALVGVCDLSGYPNITTTSVINNQFTGVTFANATSVMNPVLFESNNINTAVDFTPLGNNFAGAVRFANNSIPSVTFPVNSQSITNLDFTNNDLTAIDLTNLSNLSFIIYLRGNNITDATNIQMNITNLVQAFRIDGNSIVGVVDFTNWFAVDSIGGYIDFKDNGGITQVIFQSTNQATNNVLGRNNNINTNVDLTPFSALAGLIDFQSNSIPSVTFPTSAGTITGLQFMNNNIVNFDITPMTGANANINIDLEGNDMTTASMDSLISDLVNKASFNGWTDGTLNVLGQSTGDTPTVNTNYNNLINLFGWTIID